MDSVDSIVCSAAAAAAGRVNKYRQISSIVRREKTSGCASVDSVINNKCPTFSG